MFFNKKLDSLPNFRPFFTISFFFETWQSWNYQDDLDKLNLIYCNGGEVTIFTEQTSALFILLTSKKTIHQPESFKTAISIQKSFLGIILGAQTSPPRFDEMALISKHGMGPVFRKSR